jgi:hypothetical protein
MADNLDDLEREVEQELGRWAARLDVRPAEKGVRNLLPGQPEGCCAEKVPDAFFRSSPVPGAAVLERVRLAVAAELELAGAHRAWWWQRRIKSQGLGSLGAAAMLLLCLGLIWYVGGLKRSTSSGEVDRLVDAVPESSADPILAAVQSLEDDFRKNLALTEEEGESLGDLVQEMDRLLDERTPARSSSGADAKPTRMLG